MTAGTDWDVLVVGAGPAGSSAAQAAAEGGASVLVVERKPVVGVPVQCAEFLPRRVAMDLRLPKAAIAQDVVGTITHLPAGEATSRKNPGCILNREVADALLAERAVEAGAILMTSTKANTLAQDPDGTIRVELEGMDGQAVPSSVTASLMVGADGPQSLVGQQVGATNTRKVVAHQVTVDLHDPVDETEVYLHPTYKGGYGWLFPKGDLANIGVGVDRALGGDPKAALQHLIGTLGDRIGEVRRTTGGLIPVNGPLPGVHGNVLLAGDAAGHTHPITGGGIHQAVEAGRLAGEAAAARTTGEVDGLDGYETAFGSLFQIHLGRAVARRHELEKAWAGVEGDPKAWERLARRTWIGYKEYYKENPSKGR
jgi:digeranylgeranylglycerophospholipid reductase